MAIETIKTPRLELRELQAADKQFLAEFVLEPEQLYWMSIDFPDLASVEDFLTEARDENPLGVRKDFHLAACLAETGEFLGCVDLMQEDDKTYAAELGYFFLRRHWGHGHRKSG